MRTQRINFILLLAIGLFNFYSTTRSEADDRPVMATNSPVQVPALPEAVSPVQKFRELLGMNLEERRQVLSNRSPEVRERIFAKLSEYEAMPVAEREIRLQQTHLRWLLLNLVNLDKEQRALQISHFSKTDRELVAPRLAQWDQLPEEVRSEVLAYEHAMEEAGTGKASTPIAATNSAKLPPDPPSPPQGLVNFMKLPVEQRREIFKGFQKFFRLNETEREQTLLSLNGYQRASAVQAMALFKGLTAERRAEILADVQRLSEMDEVAQNEFFKNSERWRSLSAMERQAWRRLINRSQPLPPMPPGLALPPPLPNSLASESRRAGLRN